MTHLSIKEGLQKEICLIPVHETTGKTRTVEYRDGWHLEIYTHQGAYKDLIKLPPGNWQLIGLCSEVSEEVARGIVKQEKDSSRASC